MAFRHTGAPLIRVRAAFGQTTATVAATATATATRYRPPISSVVRTTTTTTPPHVEDLRRRHNRETTVASSTKVKPTLISYVPPEPREYKFRPPNKERELENLTDDDKLLLKYNRFLWQPKSIFAEKDRHGNPQPKVQMLPLLQRGQLRCMECAGFLRKKRVPKKDHGKLARDGGIRLFRGTRFPKVLSWPEEDIVQFYTRAATSFGVDPTSYSHASFLLKQSLLRSLMGKYKLKSQRKVYLKLGDDLGGYPVPNEKRTRRFRDESPVMFRFTCKNMRWKNACRNLPQELVTIRQHHPEWQARMRALKAEADKKRDKKVKMVDRKALERGRKAYEARKIEAAKFDGERSDDEESEDDDSDDDASDDEK